MTRTLARFLVLAVVVTLQATVHAQQARPRPIDLVKVDEAPAEGTTRKIVGGTPAVAGRFPFQVALIVSEIAPGREHFGQFCGGTLIDKRWVLTAAHCVPATTPEEVDVFLGAIVLPSGTGGATVGHRRHVVQIISHPSYDAGTHDNDVALLKLESDAPAQLTPAIVPTVADEALHALVGRNLTVIGWGATTEGGGTTPKLMQVNVAVQDRGLCEMNYQAVVPASKITNNMFCAGRPEGGADSCQGDSGGYIGVRTGPKKHLVFGVVSWGIGCAQKSLFGVYTRVPQYADWIQQTRDTF